MRSVFSGLMSERSRKQAWFHEGKTRTLYIILRATPFSVISKQSVLLISPEHYPNRNQFLARLRNPAFRCHAPVIIICSYYDVDFVAWRCPI